MSNASSSRHILSPDMPDFLGKRASLPYTPSQMELRRLRLNRQISMSHPKLPSSVCNSVDNLIPAEHSRSNSIIRLSDIRRNLSASNLAALSDSNLSIKKALPLRSYDAPNTFGSTAKRLFVQLVKQYYYQLTEGCGNQDCHNKFCHSCKDSKKVIRDKAAIFSIQLASSHKLHLCKPDSFIDRPLPPEVFKPPNGRPKPFLQTLFSSSPFKSLFTTQSKWVDSKKKFPTKSSTSSAVSPSKRGDAVINMCFNKPPSGAVKKGSSSPFKGKFTPSGSPKFVQKDEYDGQQSGISSPGSSNASHTQEQAESYSQQRTFGKKSTGVQNGPLSHQNSAPNLAYSGESDATHLLSDEFSSDELLINHYRSSSTPVGSYGNLSVSSAISFGSGPPESYPSMTSSPARLLSSQEALDETEDIREFERTVSLEMSWDGVGEFSLTHLTLPMLQVPPSVN